MARIGPASREDVPPDQRVWASHLGANCFILWTTPLLRRNMPLAKLGRDSYISRES